MSVIGTLFLGLCAGVACSELRLTERVHAWQRRCQDARRAARAEELELEPAAEALVIVRCLSEAEENPYDAADPAVRAVREAMSVMAAQAAMKVRPRLVSEEVVA